MGSPTHLEKIDALWYIIHQITRTRVLLVTPNVNEAKKEYDRAMRNYSDIVNRGANQASVDENNKELERGFHVTEREKEFINKHPCLCRLKEMSHE